jgi:hypothetical protein
MNPILISPVRDDIFRRTLVILVIAAMGLGLIANGRQSRVDSSFDSTPDRQHLLLAHPSP